MLSNQLVMVSGPIAAGKSTLGRELVRVMRARGSSVALTDLDTVAEMALPTLPDWGWAHRIHAQLVGAWLLSGIDVVVDEGTSTVEEVGCSMSFSPRITTDPWPEHEATPGAV